MKNLIFVIAFFLYMVSYAALDWDAKFSASASFEISSTTKRFTSAAILQVAQHHKVSREDDFAKHVKFDIHRKKVTICQLLSHTSGITSYAELPMFTDPCCQQHRRHTLIRIVEKEAFF